MDTWHLTCAANGIALQPGRAGAMELRHVMAIRANIDIQNCIFSLGKRLALR